VFGKAFLASNGFAKKKPFDPGPVAVVTASFNF